MKSKVYLETTVVSYLTAWQSRDLIRAAHQQITREWWQTRAKYDLFISQFVLDEAAAGDQEAAADRLKILREIELLDVQAHCERRDARPHRRSVPRVRLRAAEHLHSTGPVASASPVPVTARPRSP